MDNASKDNVYRKFEDLKRAIDQDSWNLTRTQQTSLELKLNEFKMYLDNEYAK